MDDSFFSNLEILELMIFFSGYPLICLLIRPLSASGLIRNIFKKDISVFLPYVYALTGILYLGLQLQTLYPDYSITHIRSSSLVPGLKIWGILSILFFIPVFAKKIWYSLLHSLVFFFFIVRDIFQNFFSVQDSSILQNDMHVYTYSLLINLAALTCVLIMYYLLRFVKGRKNN